MRGMHAPARVHNPVGRFKQKRLLSGEAYIEKEPVKGAKAKVECLCQYGRDFHAHSYFN
jgi:hypothetical protein